MKKEIKNRQRKSDILFYCVERESGPLTSTYLTCGLKKKRSYDCTGRVPSGVVVFVIQELSLSPCIAGHDGTRALRFGRNCQCSGAVFKRPFCIHEKLSTTWSFNAFRALSRLTSNLNDFFFQDLLGISMIVIGVLLRSACL